MTILLPSSTFLLLDQQHHHPHTPTQVYRMTSIAQRVVLLRQAEYHSKRATAQETPEGDPQLAVEEYVAAMELLVAAVADLFILGVDHGPLGPPQFRTADAEIFLQSVVMNKMTLYRERVSLLREVLADAGEGGGGLTQPTAAISSQPGAHTPQSPLGDTAPAGAVPDVPAPVDSSAPTKDHGDAAFEQLFQHFTKSSDAASKGPNPFGEESSEPKDATGSPPNPFEV